MEEGDGVVAMGIGRSKYGINHTDHRIEIIMGYSNITYKVDSFNLINNPMRLGVICPIHPFQLI